MCVCVCFELHPVRKIEGINLSGGCGRGQNCFRKSLCLCVLRGGAMDQMSLRCLRRCLARAGTCVLVFDFFPFPSPLIFSLFPSPVFLSQIHTHERTTARSTTRVSPTHTNTHTSHTLSQMHTWCVCALTRLLARAHLPI